MGKSREFLGAFFLYSVIVPLGFSIASLVIGINNIDATCDKIISSWFMPLSTWLIVYGSVNLPFVVCNAAVIYFMIQEVKGYMKHYKWYQSIGGLFIFAWNIVGAVALFRDAHLCQSGAYSMWAMVLAVLITQWIYLFLGCFVTHQLKDEE